MSRLIGLLLILRTLAITLLLVVVLFYITHLTSTSASHFASFNTNLAAVESDLAELTSNAGGSLEALAVRSSTIATFIEENIPDIELNLQPLNLTVPDALDINVPLLGNFKERLESITVTLPFTETLNNFAASYNTLTDQLESGFASLSSTATTLKSASDNAQLLARDVQSIQSGLSSSMTAWGWLPLFVGGVGVLWAISAFLDDVSRGWRLLFAKPRQVNEAT